MKCKNTNMNENHINKSLAKKNIYLDIYRLYEISPLQKRCHERASSVESAGHVAVIRRCRTTGTVRHRRMHHIFFSHRRWGWHISARIGRRRPKWMSHACRPYEDELVVLRCYLTDHWCMHDRPRAHLSKPRLIAMNWLILLSTSTAWNRGGGGSRRAALLQAAAVHFTGLEDGTGKIRAGPTISIDWVEWDSSSIG